MKAGDQRKGFTLIEVVIAAAIIVSIFSVLYGTYFAISESTKTVRAKQKLSQQATDTMTRLAKQIRCSYATDNANENKSASSKEKKDSENKIDYFYGNSDRLNDILHFITTNSILVLPPDSSEGLFDVTYKFNRNEGVLYVSQKRFAGPTKKIAKKQWTQIADNMQSIELEFFDGQKWSDKWAYRDTQKLPNAVKIEIALGSQNDRIYKCATVVNIYCGADYEKGTQPDKLAVTKNR